MRNGGGRGMRAGVFLAHGLITRRQWPQAGKPSSQVPPPAICPHNTGTRKPYLPYKISARTRGADALRTSWVLCLEGKTAPLPRPVPASLSGPSRPGSAGVCASVCG